LFAQLEAERPTDADVVDRLGDLVPDAEATAARWRDELDDGEALWNAWETERLFRAPASRMASAQARHRPDDTYLYEFHWSPDTSPLGACHGLEVPFVFGRVEPRVAFGSKPPQALADIMNHTWIAFARTGDPNHDGLPHWSPCDDGRQPMVFDDPPRMEHRPYTEIMDAWGEGLMADRPHAP
jgi:carboxylesterase type B